MHPVELETIFDPSQDNLAPINHGLHAYNLGQLGSKLIYNYFRVLIVARDQDGTVVGGIHGDMGWDWLHIDTIWVDEKVRGSGIGSRLLKQIEAEAIAKGFHGSHLETTDFQAVDFYLKNGYEVFGELEGKPKGHTWYYIKKILHPSSLGK